MRTFGLQVVSLSVDVGVSNEVLSSVADISFFTNLSFKFGHGPLEVLGGSGLIGLTDVTGLSLPNFVGRSGPLFC